MKNRNRLIFLNITNFEIGIRIFDPIITSKNAMNIDRHRIIKNRNRIFNIIFYESHIKKENFILFLLFRKRKNSRIYKKKFRVFNLL